MKAVRPEFASDFTELEFDFSSQILVYDRAVKNIDSLIRKFEKSYGVQGGEALKDISSLTPHLQRLLECMESSEHPEILALGGGSVSDFAGFCASILHRGIPWSVIPSTWLGAIDSAHGGKTALNVKGKKNQIGSFYFPTKVYLVRNLLETKDRALKQSAYGEVAKMILLDQAVYQVWRELGQARPAEQDPDLLWKLLPYLVESKLRFVNEDPFEQKGRRRLLNLGHTLGHALELELGLPHGIAVGLGLVFACRFSVQKGFLPQDEQEKIQSQVFGPLEIGFKTMSLNEQALRNNLHVDKKRMDTARLEFIFLEKIGTPALAPVNIEELVQECKRQALVN